MSLITEVNCIQVYAYISSFQVVWHSMQDEFIKQYKYLEQMINQCYPGSGITMEFDIKELLSMFMEIAMAR